MKLLDKIATVIVTLLLYFVIALLQMPKQARAAEGCELPQPTRMVPVALSAMQPLQSGHAPGSAISQGN